MLYEKHKWRQRVEDRTLGKSITVKCWAEVQLRGSELVQCLPGPEFNEQHHSEKKDKYLCCRVLMSTKHKELIIYAYIHDVQTCFYIA